MATITVNQPRQMKRRRLAGALAAALVVSIAVTGGVWVGLNRDDGESATAIQQTAPAPAAQVAAGDNATVTRTPQPLTYVLVSSQEEADRVRTGYDDANAFRAQEGGPYLEAVVVVVGSADEMAAVRQTIKDEAAFRAEQGLSGITITDLRHAPAQPAEEVTTIDVAGGAG